MSKENTDIYGIEYDKGEGVRAGTQYRKTLKSARQLLRF
jgi:hypothetical protein